MLMFSLIYHLQIVGKLLSSPHIKAEKICDEVIEWRERIRVADFTYVSAGEDKEDEEY